MASFSYNQAERQSMYRFDCATSLRLNEQSTNTRRNVQKVEHLK